MVAVAAIVVATVVAAIAVFRRVGQAHLRAVVRAARGLERTLVVAQDVHRHLAAHHHGQASRRLNGTVHRARLASRVRDSVGVSTVGAVERARELEVHRHLLAHIVEPQRQYILVLVHLHAVDSQRTSAHRHLISDRSLVVIVIVAAAEEVLRAAVQQQGAPRHHQREHRAEKETLCIHVLYVLKRLILSVNTTAKIQRLS